MRYSYIELHRVTRISRIKRYSDANTRKATAKKLQLKTLINIPLQPEPLRADLRQQTQKPHQSLRGKEKLFPFEPEDTACQHNNHVLSLTP